MTDAVKRMVERRLKQKIQERCDNLRAEIAECRLGRVKRRMQLARLEKLLESEKAFNRARRELLLDIRFSLDMDPSEFDLPMMESVLSDEEFDWDAFLKFLIQMLEIMVKLFV